VVSTSNDLLVVSTLIGDLGEFSLASLVVVLDLGDFGSAALLGDFGSAALLGDFGDLLASACTDVTAGDFGDLLASLAGFADFGERVSSFFSLI